jgi:CheY-like chemotaxis protein
MTPLSEKKESPEKPGAQKQRTPRERLLIDTLNIRRLAQQHLEVLAVVDDPFLRRMISSALAADFRLSIAPSLQEASELYLGQAPSIVFLDLGLAGSSPYDVLEELLDLEPQAYVIVLDDNDKAGETRRIASAAGAKGLIRKPCSRDAFLKHIVARTFPQK